MLIITISKILFNIFYFCPEQDICSLLEISPTNQVFLKTFNSEFQEVKIWFTDQTTKATGDLIGNKIADKITAKPSKKSHDDEVINGIPKERYISPKERQKIIDELKLA